jgi:hypothetical protein
MPCPLKLADYSIFGEKNPKSGPFSSSRIFNVEYINNPCLLQKQSQVAQAATQIPMMSYRDGYGSIGKKGECVDKDSMFRNGTILTQHGNKMLLPNPGFLTVPFQGSGRNNVCTANVMKYVESANTYTRKSCLPETHRTNFVPLVSCLAEQVQNTSHIIQEDVKKDWIRGGYPSRRCCTQNARRKKKQEQ